MQAEQGRRVDFVVLDEKGNAAFSIDVREQRIEDQALKTANSTAQLLKFRFGCP